MSIREIGLAACALASIVALGRMLFLLGWRRPVLARVIGSDYGESYRAYDRDFRRVHLFDGHLNSADITFRGIAVRARYEWDGGEYAEDVSVYVRKGDTPDRQLILWIDPDQPTRVTAAGIGMAAIWLLGIGMVAVAFWYFPF